MARTIRTRVLPILLAASALVMAPGATTQAQTGPFVFYGSGFGHGLGMSQWGAYGLALKGWKHQDVLTHYYSGTTVQKNGNEPDRIRVGLTDGVEYVHLAAKNGDVQLRVGSPTASPAATIPGGSTYLLKGGTGTYKVVDGNGKQIASIDGSKKVLATYQDAGAMVRSAEAGHTYNRGFIEFNIYRPCNGCQPKLRMIAVLAPQAYLYGLGEVPSSWPMEAMEAQADAARTYAEYLISNLGQSRAGCNCGVYDDTRNQVYAGWDHEGENGGANWVKAVDATKGEAVYYQGKLIDAVYMSSSGGYTENVENVWGGSAVPYLRGVCDPGDYTNANHAAVWRVSLTSEAVTSKLRPYTGNIGTVKGFTDFQRGVSGRVRWAKVVGTNGSKAVAGSTLRGALDLMDDRIWVNNDKNVTGAIRGKYDSLGCSPGLPTSAQTQINGGFRQRFHNGAIYRNTSANRTIWLFGQVYQEYLHEKEGAGPLGLPASKIMSITGASDCGQQLCQKAKFDNGFVFFKTDTGAHELHGAVLRYFLSQDGVLGHLGFPTSDVGATANGSQATFQGKPGGNPITVSCDTSGSCSEP